MFDDGVTRELAEHPSAEPGVSQAELGTVLCMVCNEVLYTLPTSGVKKLYGVCQKDACRRIRAIP